VARAAQQLRVVDLIHGILRHGLDVDAHATGRCPVGELDPVDARPADVAVLREEDVIADEIVDVIAEYADAQGKPLLLAATRRRAGLRS